MVRRLKCQSQKPREPLLSATNSATNTKPDILSVASPPPFLLEPLQASYTVHQKLHETDPAAFAKVASRIRAIIGSGESKIGDALISQLPALEVISIMGVGYDGVDVAAAKARGVIVTHTPGVLNDDVADLAIALMLAWARQIPRADRFVRAGDWPKGPLPLGRKMSGARLGIVGMGRIGQAIAKRATAFNMSIAYMARSAKADLPYTFHADIKTLAANSDYLVAITPGGAGTRKLIDADVMKALGPQGCIVNVARGSVVDETALIAALQAGTIAGAALDVFENEPNVPQALRDLDNVVLVPHIGSATTQTRHAMAKLAFDNLHAQMTGKPLLTPVPECQ
jgi:hydroxypyruvate reductase